MTIPEKSYDFQLGIKSEKNFLKGLWIFTLLSITVMAILAILYFLDDEPYNGIISITICALIGINSILISCILYFRGECSQLRIDSLGIHYMTILIPWDKVKKIKVETAYFDKNFNIIVRVIIKIIFSLIVLLFIVLDPTTYKRNNSNDIRKTLKQMAILIELTNIEEFMASLPKSYPHKIKRTIKYYGSPICIWQWSVTMKLQDLLHKLNESFAHYQAY